MGRRARRARAIAGVGFLALAGGMSSRQLPGKVFLWPAAIVPTWFGVSHLVASVTGYEGCPELGAIPSVILDSSRGDRLRAVGEDRPAGLPPASSPEGVLFRVSTVRSLALFAFTATAEIGGAYMIWVGLRQGKGVGMVVAGAFALILYGLAVTQQPSHAFGRVLAAYGGVFVLGSLLWGAVFDGFHPDSLRPGRRGDLLAGRWDHHVHAPLRTVPA